MNEVTNYFKVMVKFDSSFFFFTDSDVTSVQAAYFRASNLQNNLRSGLFPSISVFRRTRYYPDVLEVGEPRPKRTPGLTEEV